MQTLEFNPKKVLPYIHNFKKKLRVYPEFVKAKILKILPKIFLSVCDIVIKLKK